MNDSEIHEAFRHCPQCGEKASSVSHHRRFICSHCEFCYYFNAATAAGAIIANDRGEVLLIERKNDPARGKLSIPGGFVDPGESAETALHREVLEEVNLEINQVSYLTSAANRYTYRGITYHTTDLFFVASAVSLTALSPEAKEVNAIEFLTISPEVLDRVAFPTLQHALKCYQAHQ